MDAVGRSILALPPSVPAFHHMDTLGEQHYPYCSTLFFEQVRDALAMQVTGLLLQCRDSGHWRLPSSQLPPITSVGGDTRASLKFMQR